MGGEQNFYVILLMDDAAVNRFTAGKFKFGGEARGTAGNANGGVAGDVNSRHDNVLVYVDRQGLFGGASLKGGTISSDMGANRVYYDHFATMEGILFGNQVQTSDAAHNLADTINKYSGNNYSASTARPGS